MVFVFHRLAFALIIIVTSSSMLLQKHKALGSPCFSRLRRQRVSTVYYGIFISVCLCLQMPMLAAEPLQSHWSCKPVTDNLDEKTNLSCSLMDTQNVENMQIVCFQSQGFQCRDQYKGGRDRPEEAMKKYADGPLRKANLMRCSGSMILKFLDDEGHYNCTFNNGNRSSEEQKMKDAKSMDMRVISMIAVLVGIVVAILVILYYRKRNKLQNWWRNRSSSSQPSPGHCTSDAIQPPYVPATDTDPEDDDLYSVVTDGSADTAADTATATADTPDAVPGETSVNPSEDLYPSGAAMDTVLTADAESRDSAYCDSYNSASLDAEAYWLCCRCRPGYRGQERPPVQIQSQKQVEMQVFTMNRQVYNPEHR